ncbi:ABC transporter ATP-binding protein [Aquirufa sp.]|jgi:lipopolysaccharide transport system ATP-binding protein|uniref:ABC transporter ATP-binding protein n=1 Tax=Aquirufa sp. TaxID=2676249 RepID=UPI0037C0A735
MNIVEVNNITKKYNLNRLAEPISLRNGFKSLFIKQEKSKDYYALQDVSFSIKKGDKLGIIGNNGAGKSTLLKILSRITNPTSGNIQVKGKVASLLEVGTGFHPELSGRENIFLNGAILGMSKRDIKAQFDEIVEFAGPQISNFLDTPVKRYSSGMYIRLGFAISAHLNPEILIVDEVLAVGDADFQKKSLGKMKEVAANEKTILFVSHNLTAVSNLCNKTLHLEKGSVKQMGETAQVIKNYMSEVQSKKIYYASDNFSNAIGNEFIRLKYAEVKPQLTQGLDYWTINDPFSLHFEFYNTLAQADLNISVHLYASTGECIFNLGNQPTQFKSGIISTDIQIPGNYLNDGSYFLSIMVVKNSSIVLANFEELFEFEIADYRENTTWYGKWPGYVRPNFPIVMEQVSTEI